MRKFLIFVLLILGGFAFACDFTFEPSSVNGKLGETVIIKVTIDKTHKNCSLTTMDEYHLEFTGVQLMGETPWKAVNSNTYEKWLKVSLSEAGSESIKIWKKCSKDGYEEKILPIMISANDNLSGALKENKLGFDTDLKYETLKIENLFLDKATTLESITINGEAVSLFEKITLQPGEYTVIYEDKARGVIAVFNDNYIYRFDHYLLARG